MNAYCLTVVPSLVYYLILGEIWQAQRPGIGRKSIGLSLPVPGLELASRSPFCDVVVCFQQIHAPRNNFKDVGSPERHLPKRRESAYPSKPQAETINASPIASRTDQPDISFCPRWAGDILVMAHVAKLGALTDELVVLLTSTSARVDMFRSVS